MKPHNLILKAIGSLDPIANSFRKAAISGVKPKLLNRDVGTGDLLPLQGATSNIDSLSAYTETRLLQEAMRQASCWSLSDDALNMIWHTDFYPELFADCHLPYEIMAVEYEFYNEKLGLGPVPEGNEQGAQRVTVVAESNNIFSFTSFFHSETFDSWFPAFYYIVLTQQELIELAEYWKANPPASGERKQYAVGLRGLIHSLNLSDSFINDAANANPMMDEIRIVMSLLQVLFCENAPVERIPAPEKLNKKRIKRGRRDLIPSYMTLNITSGASRSGHKPTHGGSTGPRATHWRRGHIHRWRTKKGYIQKWLPPMIINPTKDTPTYKDVKVL